MKPEIWDQLLVELALATETGEIEWTRTDSPGSVVAAFDDASVVVRNAHSPLGGLVGARGEGHLVEIRNEHGNRVASLDGRSRLSVSGSAIDAFRVGEIIEEADAEASVSQVRSIAALVNAIRSQNRAGERAAESILGELRSG